MESRILWRPGSSSSSRVVGLGWERDDVSTGRFARKWNLGIHRWKSPCEGIYEYIALSPRICDLSPIYRIPCTKTGFFGHEKHTRKYGIEYIVIYVGICKIWYIIKYDYTWEFLYMVFYIWDECFIFFKLWYTYEKNMGRKTWGYAHSISTWDSHQYPWMWDMICMGIYLVECS